MKATSNTTERRSIDWLVIVVVFAWVLMFFTPPPPGGRAPVRRPAPDPVSGPRPPDLSDCTRLEIEYVRPVYDVVTQGGRVANLLEAPEKELLQSVKIITIEDRERIKIVCDEIAKARYADMSKQAKPSVETLAYITGYDQERRVATLNRKDGLYLETEDGRWFHYNRLNLNVAQFAPPLAPIVIRCRCADNLWSLYHGGMYSLVTGPDGAYARPDQWSSTVARSGFYEFAIGALGEETLLEMARRALTCPGARPLRCSYAMNPNCEPNSPPDMVLLFETDIGWNQHGGPELFTFDNHDPRGGCVLLNDGTVRFIRTEEELYALRWK